MSKNMGNLMRQAQEMQKKMADIQAGLAEKTCQAASGGGMVTVTVNGALKVTGIKIDPAVVTQDDVEMLEDLVVAAVNEGLKRAQEMANEEMGKVTAGLNLPPGLF
ncbi:Nucleoid-associated protein YaaK [hydrothermal vent metagenome]|uniref:Nucleoid-associated protein YaaK n=1 Tax=hydrothermal vent metagenome TaxID=652676 RepID=A0A3B0VF17_9ZZZZ